MITATRYGQYASIPTVTKRSLKISTGISEGCSLCGFRSVAALHPRRFMTQFHSS